MLFRLFFFCFNQVLMKRYSSLQSSSEQTTRVGLIPNVYGLMIPTAGTPVKMMRLTLIPGTNRPGVLSWLMHFTFLSPVGPQNQQCFSLELVYLFIISV